MPGRGRYSAKEDRIASHVADSEISRGMSPKEAKSIGYATLNKYKRAHRKSKRSGRR